jgi:hypothetical protein
MAKARRRAISTLSGALLFFCFIGISYAAFSCSQDGTLLTWTGNTKTFNGKLLYEHECMSGHKFWLESAN